jgi:hypothetical protein
MSLATMHMQLSEAQVKREKHIETRAQLIVLIKNQK